MSKASRFCGPTSKFYETRDNNSPALDGRIYLHMSAYLLAGCLSFTQPGSHSGISVGHVTSCFHADVLEIVRERANGIGQFRWGCRIQARKVDIRRLQVSPGGRWPPLLPSQRNDGATSFAQNRSAARRLRNQGNGLGRQLAQTRVNSERFCLLTTGNPRAQPWMIRPVSNSFIGAFHASQGTPAKTRSARPHGWHLRRLLSTSLRFR